MGGWGDVLGGAGSGAAIGSAIPGLGTGIGALIGGLGSLLFGGKKSEQPTQYTSGMSPQDTAFRQMLMNYLTQKLQQPYQYARPSSGTSDAMKMIYKTYFNKKFTPTGPGTSA